MRKRINLYCSQKQKEAINKLKKKYSPNFSAHVDSWIKNAMTQIFLDTKFAESQEKNIQLVSIYLQETTLKKLEKYLLCYFGDRKHKSKFIKSLILSGKCREKTCSR